MRREGVQDDEPKLSGHRPTGDNSVGILQESNLEGVEDLDIHLGRDEESTINWAAIEINVGNLRRCRVSYESLRVFGGVL